MCPFPGILEFKDSSIRVFKDSSIRVFRDFTPRPGWPNILVARKLISWEDGSRKSNPLVALDILI